MPTSHAQFALATLHPAALLRMTDANERRDALAALVKRLKLAYHKSQR